MKGLSNTHARLNGTNQEITKAQPEVISLVDRRHVRKRDSALLAIVLTSAATVLLSSNTHGAPLSMINAYIGIAKTIKSAVGAFIGETTVIPACALARWDHYDYGIYGKNSEGKPNYFGQHLQVIRDPHTGDFSYKTELRDCKTGKWFVANRDVISIPRLSRLTWTCVPTPRAPFIYNTLEDFSLHVWAASVTKTGYFPPREPYTAFVKCDATSCQYNCADLNFTPRQTKIRSKPILLRDSGTVMVKMPIPQYEYSFPPLLWVGKWYEY